MRNMTIVALSAALAAAIVTGIVLFQRYRNAQDALLVSEGKLAELHGTVSRLTEETSALQDQARKNAEDLKEVASAKARISELEEAIAMKDQVISEFDKAVRIVQKGLEQEKNTRQALETELAAREAMVTGLQKEVQGLQSNILYLQEQIAQEHSKMEALEGELSALKGERATAERKVGQLKSTYEALISEHLEELKNAKERISELESAIKMKDQRLSESEKRLRTLQEDLEEEKKTKDASLAQLRKRLQDAQSHSRFLEEEDAKKRNELGKLAEKLLTLQGEKATAERKVGQLKSTYEALICDLKEQIENQEVTIKRFEEKISVTFIDRILFEFGRATVSPEGEEILRKVGESLRAVKGKKIKVVGHTDDRPINPEYYFKFPSNWELSAARASAVVRHFQEETGLDPASLEAVGRSFYNPVSDNDTAEGRAQNRRVEIIIAPEFE
jgi:chemotaxis protein MotB